MLPADVAGSAPATLAKPIEPTVIANAICRVGLDWIAGQVAKAGPAVEEPRVVGDDAGNRSASLVGVIEGKRRGQAFERVGSLGSKDRLGWTRWRERNWGVRHVRKSTVVSDCQRDDGPNPTGKRYRVGLVDAVRRTLDDGQGCSEIVGSNCLGRPLEVGRGPRPVRRSDR